MSGHLDPGGQKFRGDRGAADPLLAAALAAYQSGQGTEQAALTALAAARLDLSTVFELITRLSSLAKHASPSDAFSPQHAGRAPPTV